MAWIQARLEVTPYGRASAYTQEWRSVWDDLSGVLCDHAFLLNTPEHWLKERTLSDLADLIDEAYGRNSARIILAANVLRRVDYLVYKGHVAIMSNGAVPMIVDSTTVDIPGEDGTMHQSTTYSAFLPGLKEHTVHESALRWEAL